MMGGTLTSYLPIVVAALSALGVALAGGLLTEIGPWYGALAKPSWQPPNWAFAPAWTLIFTLCAVSGVLAWRDIPSGEGGTTVLAAFALNAVLNMAWSALFFRARRPDWALIELIALWASIGLCIAVTARYNTLSAILLLPYLAWVTFAGVLNATIVRLNGPFDTSGT